MTTTITTDIQNYNLSTLYTKIPEINEERNIKFAKYCSGIYIGKESLFTYLPEMESYNLNELKVKIITPKENLIIDYDFIPLNQVIDILKSKNQISIIISLISVTDEFSKDNFGLLHKDEAYYSIEDWKTNTVYKILRKLNSLSDKGINNYLSQVYKIMERQYQFNMDKARQEFDEYRIKNNPTLNSSAINAIAYKEEYKQIFMLALREIYSRMEKQIQNDIFSMQNTLINIKRILDGETNFSNEKLSTEQWILDEKF